MNGQAAQPALPSTRRLPAPPWLGWAVAAGAAGIAAASGVAPFAILAVVLVLAAAVGALHSPVVFLCIITAVSGVGLGWTHAAALNFGNYNINVNGLQWSLIMATAAVVLVRHGTVHVPRPLWGWAALVALAGAGVLWAPDRFEAIKQFLLYLGPLLTAAVAFAAADRRGVAALQAALFAGAALAIGLGAVTALGGDLLGGPLDPGGRPLHRALGTFLLPVAALSLARIRYGDARHVFPVFAIALATLATLSRTTLGALGLVVVFVVLSSGWRARLALAAAGLIAVTAAMSYEPLRERLFTDSRVGFTARFEVSGRGDSADLHFGGLHLSGRGAVWIQTFLHGRQAPVLGHGTGSSTLFVAERTRGGALFPHNEYLRVFHDFGTTGVAALLAAFGFALAGMRRIRRAAASTETAVLAYAATLAWLAFAIIAVFDNPLGYFVFFTHNVLLLTVLAVRSAHLDSESGNLPSADNPQPGSIRDGGSRPAGPVAGLPAPGTT